jgi:hypothetical protein
MSAAFVLPLLATGAAGAQQGVGSWIVYGNDAARSSATEVSLSPPSVRPAWYTPVSGRISSQVLVAENVPSPGARTVYVATTKGVVYALAENGYIRWRVELGQLERFCAQVDGYGVIGTPAIAPELGVLFLVDAFGRLHALDLATGVERAGWPIRLFADFRRELVWGALTIVDGSIYVGTGAYCDRPMVGKVFRVEIATRRISRWLAVPPELGGGGGVWGWGGIAYSSQRGSLFVATGNAFRRGKNVGRRFREWAGYGEHLVELSRTLRVRAASHPKNIRQPRDLDFVGSPVVFPHNPCGELVAVLNKNGFVYVWRSSRVRAGPLFSLRLARPTSPLLSQAAYSPRTGALYVSTPGRLVRIDVTLRCKPRMTWARRLGNGLFNGSPTIAGDTVWLVENANRGSSLLGFDARTGAKRFRAALAGPAYVAPTVVGERIYIGTFTGGVQGFALASALARPAGSSASALPEYLSFADGLHGWASREEGVFATDDGGRTWRSIYPRSAAVVVRTSSTAGIIVTGDQAAACGCRTVRLWTGDGGATWNRTGAAQGSGLVGSGGTLWWWRGGALFRAVAWPPPPATGLRGQRMARTAGAIVDVKPVPGGVLALASNRLAGLGFDQSPRLLLVQADQAQVLRLPRVGGDVIVRSLAVSWPSATVTASDVTAFTRGEQGVVTWSTSDGGRSWTVSRR